MADKENKRKCFKCGSSPAVDGVKLFRFPKPSVRNVLRCELWAKFIAPEKQYSSNEFQMKLHNEHRMLCQKHFHCTEFTDDTKKRLLLSAVPSDIKHSIVIPVQPGPSQRGLLTDITITSNLTNSSEPSPSTSSVHSTVIRREDPTKIALAKCKKYMNQICYLQKRIKNLRAINVVSTLSDELSVKKLSKKLTPTFARLLQDQLRNYKKKKTGRRWSKDVKITALRLFKRSPTCYRLLRRLFHLPTPGTLRALLNKIPFVVGVNEPVLKIIKNYLNTRKASDNQFVLMFDEMSLKKHLNYNIKEDHIEGYQDHAKQGRSPQIASYALVFMIAGIRQKVKQPIAHYFSSGFSTADRLAVLVKEVLHCCFANSINVAAVVCDMDGVNRRALTIMGASVQHPYFEFENKEIISFFDVPHLLKCFRNLFLKYNIECKSNISSDAKIGRGIAKWSHIKEFYEIDNKNQHFVFCPTLSKEHINPNNKQKMRVKLAAQVLSHSVAGGMYAKISTGELPADATVTADVIQRIDKLFDSLNSDSSDLRRGKIYATNLTPSSPHHKLFMKMKDFFQNLNFIGCTRTPPSKEGWIWTLNAMERLWKNLSNTYKIKSLATRRLQQDPIENLFGCIRGNCGSNTNPTTAQFLAGLKTAVISNSRYFGNGNCEEDNNILINNLNAMLTVPYQPTHRCTETECSSDETHFLVSEEDNENPELQACAYVCGFLLKKMAIQCDLCKNILFSKDMETYHIFTEFKEYSDVKKSLTYSSKKLVICVENCATVINKYLNEKGHVPQIKVNVLEIIDNCIDFDFLSLCKIHQNENKNKIVNAVFLICIKRFCITKNRIFAEEASKAALKRKMDIILHK